MFERLPLLPSGHLVYSPPAEFDLAAVPVVESELRDLLELHRWVAIDLSGVTFIDSSGLSALIWAVHECQRNDGDLVVLAPSERILRLFEITQIQQIFAIYDSPDDVPPVGSADREPTA